MSQPPQQFCVRWNSYHTNLQTVFPKLLTTENFVDVTLACENRQIKCHKVVLSACSTYFERLLIQNPCKHPIIFMKDMRFSEMQSLVDFMYKGEVNVSQDDLPSLLKSAEALQIRGLCGSETPGAAPPELPVAPAPQIAIPLVPANHMVEATSPRDHADNTNHSSKSSSLPPPSPNPSTPSPVSNGPSRRRRAHDISATTNGERSPSECATHANSASANNPNSGSIASSIKLRRADSLKQETVEEDGLYYGDIDLGEMDCSDQAEEDLLQTGNVSGQPTAGTKKAFIRVKKQSELCHKSSEHQIEETLLNRLQQCPQITFKTYQKNGHNDCLKNAKEIMNNEPKIESNPSYKKGLLVTSQYTAMTASNAIVNKAEEGKMDQQVYEDKEYLEMWLLQNQQLEVSLSNGNNEMQKVPNEIQNTLQNEVVKPASVSKKLGDEQRWLQYYTNNFTTPKEKDVAYLDYVFTGKKCDKSAKKKAKVGDECLNLLNFLDPADLDQFLAGKEVSSSGISRNAIEQAMLGKYNPNRRYSNEAMWAALMDVKKGGSIYRAAQTHKVPRKSLRNWMKRWHIKSSFPMPQQLKQFVENNKKHKSKLRMDLTSTLLSLGTRNKITPDALIPTGDNTTQKSAKNIKQEDLIDSDAFNHFMDNDYYRAGEIRGETSSGDDIDNNKDNGNAAVKDDFDSGYTQIMDMSGNILFDDGVASNHEEEHIEEGDLNETEGGKVDVDSSIANVKKVSFSNVEQLAGLNGDDSEKMNEA